MPADVGNQDITLLWYTRADSAKVNKRFRDIRQLGIYSGGRLTIVDGPTKAASLSSLVCEISDGTHQVRVETTTAVGITVAQATPYVVLRWSYTGASSDYMEILAVATPSTYDLVVGKGDYGGAALTGFDYGDASYPRSTPHTQDLFLKVEPTEDTELRVRLRAGRIHTNSGRVAISDQKSNLFTAPSANSKIYLLYVDTSDGTIKIDSSGTEAASPVAPDYRGRMVLAEITLASTDTNITASKIRDVRCFIDSSPADSPGIKAWARFDASPGPNTITIGASYNIASITELAGLFTVTFTTDIVDANYAILESTSADETPGVATLHPNSSATTGFTFTLRDENGATIVAPKLPSIVSFAIVR